MVCSPNYIWVIFDIYIYIYTYIILYMYIYIYVGKYSIHDGDVNFYHRKMVVSPTEMVGLGSLYLSWTQVWAEKMKTAGWCPRSLAKPVQINLI